MKRMRPFVITATLASFCLIPTARALQIVGYDAALHERFAFGFEAGTPVVNTSASFVLSGYDLSGVGWQTASNDFAVTLISPRHALTATHVAPGVGASVSFLGTDGLVRSYTVAQTTTLTFGGTASDATLVRLSTAVESNWIKSYAGLGLSTAAAYVGLPVALYGANGRVGLNTVAGLQTFDLIPFSSGPNVASGDGMVDSVISYTTFESTPGESQGQGGDSGSPTFVRMANGDLALLGVHSAIGTTTSGVQVTIDSVPLLASQSEINALLAADGYGPWTYYTEGVASAIPEPASFAGVAALGTFVAAGLRRRRD
ncbi:MAG: hypothetical protein RLZZ50_2037 [Verrucomicrobiota bacterium]